mmetsp:Transcript_28333/g.81951  ORF Transcript_28333/g.81951 Transcript_28333/m.81951 type:complete len:604 (+) Transcript_28333:171-1982(+)
MGRPSSLVRIVSYIVPCLLSFYVGALWGAHACLEQDIDLVADGSRHLGGGPGFPILLTPTINPPGEKNKDHKMRGDSPLGEHLGEESAGVDDKKQRRIPASMQRIADGIARTSKEEFVKLYDFGIPYDRPQADMADVLLLYQTERALPDKMKDEAVWNRGDEIPFLSAADATKNCQQMNVILTKLPDSNPQCTAVMANYQSYHIQRWMKLPESSGGLDSSLPLRLVSRGDAGNGRKSYKPPREEDIRATFDMLRTYLSNLDDVLTELKPIAEEVAKDNTIIVMTCNFGQSELLMNFACSASARGFDLSNVLVFATDTETKEIAEGLGLAVFYDEKNSKKIPSDAARRYGDQRFVAMMFAKVVCVQLISLLGYDLLFQDVDVVWYKDPLPFFHDKTSPISHFDVYFQDDGAHSLRYAPFSANSGFYYARNNDRTRYLFTSLLYAQDIIRRTESHQQALIALLNEHSSLFGLKVKVLNRDENDFPGGWHYHHSGMSSMMRDMVNGEANPFIFHMSWTNNKMNKIKFFQQMGDWHVNENCIAKSVEEISSERPSAVMEEKLLASLLRTECCLVEPSIKCHYRDKPSIIPCRDNPPIDKTRPSWWKG